MTLYNVILILLGLIIIGMSYFISEKLTSKDNKEQQSVQANIDVEQFWSVSKDEIEKKIERLLKNRDEEIIANTDEELSKISNEKIIAVNEYSNQVLEKIDQNHKEVVFLYNMLNDKEAELKEYISEFNVTKAKLINIIDDLKHQYDIMEKRIKDNQNVSSNNNVSKNIKTLTDKSKEDISNNVYDTNDEKTSNIDKNKMVIKLYKEGHSVVEISKILNMGQGEVNFIINLAKNY